MLLNNNWLNCLEIRNKHPSTNATKTCWQGMEYKNKIIKFSSRTLTFVLADPFNFTSFMKSWCLLFAVSISLKICFLFSINDVRLDPLSSPGELSSQFLLFCFYLKNDQRTFINAKLQREGLFVINWQITLSYNFTEENWKVTELIIPQNIAIVTSRVI